jgi:hypothetical protein
MSTNLNSWSSYLDAMKSAGELQKRTWRPDDEQYRGDLYRQLIMNISYAYFQYFQSNESHPDFMPLWNSVFMLQPNPDDAYLWAPLNGKFRYRIVGDRGSIHILSIQLGHQMIGMSDTPKGYTDYFEVNEEMVDRNGKIEIVLSKERPPEYGGYWRKLDPHIDYAIVRQRSYDWGNEIDSRLAIECLDAPAVKRHMSVGEIAERLEKLVKVPERWSALWIDWQNDLLRKIGPNKFESNTFAEMSGAANQVYWQAIFEMSPGEALILETDLPQVRPYWNVQVNDPLFNAVEFVCRQSSLNGHQAYVDSDGKFRAVVCNEDPGVPNWLDAGGYWQGTVIGRWTSCDSSPLPVMKKVPFAEVRKYLPADTPFVSSDERKQALRLRRLGGQLRRRW